MSAASVSSAASTGASATLRVLGGTLAAAKEFTVGLTHVPDLVRGHRLADGHSLSSITPDIELAVAHAQQHCGLSPQWRIQQIIPTVSDVAVVEIGSEQTQRAAIIKLGRSEAGNVSLLEQQNAITGLLADPRIGQWVCFVPRLLAVGKVSSSVYSVENPLPGTSASELPMPILKRALIDAIDVIAQLHQSTGTLERFETAMTTRLIDEPLALLENLPMSIRDKTRRSMIRRLQSQLHCAVEGRTLWMCRTHGDFTPGNLLVDPLTAKVTGVIDWDRSCAVEPAFVDPWQLLLAVRASMRQQPIGHVVRDLCAGAPMSSTEAGLLERFWKTCPGDHLDTKVLALLTWLRHVENNLTKSSRYEEHRLWVHRNVASVLTSIR